MPDDKISYAEAQKRHADKLRLERDLTRVTGLSRSQLRELEHGLKDFDRRVAARNPAESVRPTPPEIKETETTIERRNMPINTARSSVANGTIAKGNVTAVRALQIVSGVLTAADINVLTA